MDELKIVDEASPGIRALAPGIFASLGMLIRGGQDRNILEAEQEFIERRLQSGNDNFRYRGRMLEYDAYADANEKEIERIATNTLNTLRKTDVATDWSKVNLSKFNPEFGRRWASEASNVSDETLQTLWAQLLKGELESPGSVSNDTMSVARDMTKERAEEFQILCSAALYDLQGEVMTVVSCGALGQNALQPFGLSFGVLMNLAHHRLIVGDVRIYHGTPVALAKAGVHVQHQGSTWFIQFVDNVDPTAEMLNVDGVMFTLAGKELARVVEQMCIPEYTETMSEYLLGEGWIFVPVDRHVSEETN
ncbi:MAG: DUF2806 domain-containing protein [Chloroflexi bacterium]|nr:DUF2806 domain-containing protein [Chloroflexota bacterium]